MSDKNEEALRVLGLEPGASEQAIKSAYRDLVKVWHPDRFGSDARLREKAQNKLREVTAAFEELRGYGASDFEAPRQPASRGDRIDNSRGPRVAGPPVGIAKDGRVIGYVFIAAVIAFVGTSLFMVRNYASWRIPMPVSVASTPAPAARPPVRHEPDETASIGADHQTARPTTGSLIVASRPLGARVSFDGHLVGDTPIVLPDVMPGEHHIEVSVDGNAYQSWSSSVVVTAGMEEKLLAVMTPTKGYSLDSR